LNQAGIGFGTWGNGQVFHNHNPSVGIDTARAQYGISSDIAWGSEWVF
jgi:hypothetical protein